MAHVTFMSLSDRDDGQMLLMAGFIVAFGLIAITLMLSDILYATSLASEASMDPVKYDFLNLQQLANSETKNAYKSSTINGYTNWSTFEKYNSNYIGNISKIYAGEGYAIKVERGSPYEVRFTANGLLSGNPEWRVVGNATNIYTFKIYNYNYSVGDSFQIDVVNLTGIRLYSVKINTIITIINRTGAISTISLTDPVDLLAIGDTPFTFNTNTQGQTYSIYFNNGDQIAGRFNITGKSASNQTFIKARDYMINSTISLTSSRARLNITTPVSVPW